MNPSTIKHFSCFIIITNTTTTTTTIIIIIINLRKQVEPAARGGCRKFPAARNEDWKTSFAYRSWSEASHVLNCVLWIRPHLASPPLSSRSSCQTISVRLNSSHNSSQQLSNFLIPSQLSSTVFTSSHLFSILLNSSQLFSPLATSFQPFPPLLTFRSAHLTFFSIFFTPCQLFSSLVNSSPLFSPLPTSFFSQGCFTRKLLHRARFYTDIFLTQRNLYAKQNLYAEMFLHRARF